MSRPLIAVVGGSSCTSEEAEWATTVGRLLAHSGAVLLCGGLGGVMEAAARGAAQAGGLTIGILPGDDPAEANSSIAVAIPTGMGEMRNALLVRAARAVIAIGGGWGTLSEIALAQRMRTPVVGLHDAFRSAAEIPRVERPEEAVRWALEQAERRAVY
ncbi:MAG TPA: TIGR00725 family protein [Gemmatimonadales bacterium]|nr:TIGR00725 family protein [Gemmatimonadales bacterium]